MGITNWVRTMPKEDRPTVILEFGTDTGQTTVPTPNGTTYEIPDPRCEPRPMLHRYTAGFLVPEDQSWLRLATFEAQASELFQTLLNFPVGVLPTPHQAVTSCRNRAGQHPITISFLGHQRLEKGFAMVPGLVDRLLKTLNNVRVLVHNGWPEGCVIQQNMLRDIAARDPRLILNEETADATLWSQLLEQSDIIVCPYRRNRFISSYSAVATEAIANAIPLVVPAGTTLDSLLQQFGNPGVTFEGDDIDSCEESIFRATVTAVQSMDELAHLAEEASLRWNKTRGAKCLADTMLAWHSRS